MIEVDLSSTATVIGHPQVPSSWDSIPVIVPWDKNRKLIPSVNL